MLTLLMEMVLKMDNKLIDEVLENDGFYKKRISEIENKITSTLNEEQLELFNLYKHNYIDHCYDSIINCGNKFFNYGLFLGSEMEKTCSNIYDKFFNP